MRGDYCPPFGSVADIQPSLMNGEDTGRDVKPQARAAPLSGIGGSKEALSGRG